jgi:hypothetical protein
MFEDTLLKTAREAAFERRDFTQGFRAGSPRVVIFLEKEQVHLAGRAPQRRLL